MITYTCDRCGKKIFGEVIFIKLESSWKYAGRLNVQYELCGECAEEIEPKITTREDE